MKLCKHCNHIIFKVGKTWCHYEEITGKPYQYCTSGGKTHYAEPEQL